jgi:hypothetical protein
MTNPTYIPDGADNVNLGSAGYAGATNFEIKPYYFVEGLGYAPNGTTGDTAIQSEIGGITLTSDAEANIVAQTGLAQATLTSPGGTGGIGVDLQADDSFFNSARVQGGFGGSYHTDVRPTNLDAGAGGVGVSLAQGAYLSNAGSITGGGGGGSFYPVGSEADQFLETGRSAVGVEVAGGVVINSGSITGGGVQNNEAAGAAGVQLDTGTTANYLHNTASGVITGGMGDNGGAGVNLVAYNSIALQPHSSYAVHGTIYNQGQINGGFSSSGVGGDGVDVGDGQGFATNTNTDLDNLGTISGGVGQAGGGIGVELGANDIGFSSGTIEGGNALSGSGAAGGTGLSLGGDDFVAATGGTIQGGAGDGGGNGGAGVYFASGFGTSLHVFDTTVAGGAGGSGGAMGDAVRFASSGFANLAIYSNDTFIGQVAGSYTAEDSLTLSDSGTLSFGQGTQFTGFDELIFGSQASWTVDTNTATLGNLVNVNGYISGFATGNALDVTNLPNAEVQQPPVFTVTSTDSSSQTENGTLAITTYNPGDQVTQTYDITFDGLALGSTFQATADGSGGTDITLQPQAACYLRGTLIRTTRGEVPIEALTISDQVLCRAGHSRAVRWLGHRRIDCSRYPDPRAVWPICIRAGALAEHQPSRDLWVSPGHSVLVDDVLIQAERLVNGVTVVRVPRERVEYWHVELDAHDLLWAEGLAAESYLDTGNRTAFVNGGAFLEAYPDFRPKDWRETCVPLAIEGPALVRARARVLRRAQELGYAITHDAGVHVLADGDRIDPMTLGEGRIAFVIPAARRSIELRCRTFVPSHVDAASLDERQLGVAVGRLQIDGIDWPLDDATRFPEGWHGLEMFADGSRQRWSSGCTRLPAGTRLVVIDIAGRSYCWREPEQAVALCC